MDARDPSDNNGLRCVSDSELFMQGMHGIEDPPKFRCISQPMKTPQLSLPDIGGRFSEPVPVHRKDEATNPSDDPSNNIAFSPMIPLGRLNSFPSQLLTSSDYTSSESISSLAHSRQQEKVAHPSTYIPLRHFVHEASHILHNYHENIKDWCERRFSRKDPHGSKVTVDIERGTADNDDIRRDTGPPQLDGPVDGPEPHHEPVTPGKQSRGYRVFPDEPSFIQWWRVSWLDLLTLLLCSLTSLAINSLAPPMHNRVFSVYDFNGNIATPELAYPMQSEYISTLYSALIGTLVPLLTIILISYFLVGSFWDMDNAVCLPQEEFPVFPYH